MQTALYFKDSELPELPEYIAASTWEVCCQGLREERGVLLSYEDQSGVCSERTVFPEVIFDEGGVWYLAAFCSLRHEPRTFRFDRISSAAMTDERSASHGIAEEYKTQGIPWRREEEEVDFDDDDDDDDGELEEFLNSTLPPVSQGYAAALSTAASLRNGTEKVPSDVEDMREAICGANIEELLRLIEKGADVNAFFAGYSMLMLAASSFHNDEVSTLMVKILLEHGAAVDLKDRKGTTALFYAAGDRKLQVIKTLLEAGADPNVKDNRWKYTPLLWLFYVYEYQPFRIRSDEAAFKIVKLLCEAGADVNSRTKGGNTPLMFAGGKVMEYLISRGADVNAATSDGSTVAMYHADSLRDLLILEKHGADMFARNSCGESILSWTTIDYRHVSFLIRRYGFSVNEKVCGGKSVLQAAIEERDVETVRFLVSCGAEVSSEYLGTKYYELPHRNDPSGQAVEEIIKERIIEITRSLIRCCQVLDFEGIKKWIAKGAVPHRFEEYDIPGPLSAVSRAFLQSEEFTAAEFEEICDFLISAGAFRDETDSEGYSFLGALLARGQRKRAAAFLERYKKETNVLSYFRFPAMYLRDLEKKRFIYSYSHGGEKAPLLEMMINFLREEQP